MGYQRQPGARAPFVVVVFSQIRNRKPEGIGSHTQCASRTMLIHKQYRSARGACAQQELPKNEAEGRTRRHLGPPLQILWRPSSFTSLQRGWDSYCLWRSTGRYRPETKTIPWRLGQPSGGCLAADLQRLEQASGGRNVDMLQRLR